MKEIKLSKKGKYKGIYVAQVDDEDFRYLNQFNYSIAIGKSVMYARRRIIKNGKPTLISMHNDIMGRAGVDHKDHNGLNNQKYNLRFCTSQENNMNAKPNRNAVSKYKGVGWHKLVGKWYASIQKDFKLITIGWFENEVDAAKAYDLKAKELFGEFAYLNFDTE